MEKKISYIFLEFLFKHSCSVSWFKSFEIILKGRVPCNKASNNLSIFFFLLQVVLKANLPCTLKIKKTFEWLIIKSQRGSLVCAIRLH